MASYLRRSYSANLLMFGVSTVLIFVLALSTDWVTAAVPLTASIAFTLILLLIEKRANNGTMAQRIGIESSLLAILAVVFLMLNTVIVGSGNLRPNIWWISIGGVVAGGLWYFFRWMTQIGPSRT